MAMAAAAAMLVNGYGAHGNDSEENPRHEGLGAASSPAAKLKNAIQDAALKATPGQRAALRIQKAARKSLLQGKIFLKRKALIQRLVVEVEMFEGSITIALNLLLFAFLALALVAETANGPKAGLRKIFENEFELHDTEDINSISQLEEYFGVVAGKSRGFQMLSSQYFQEQEAEITLQTGFQTYGGTDVIEDPDLTPRIETPVFSFIAWISFPPGSGGYVVRKRLGTDQASKDLSCWAWYVGDNRRFDFGANDFGGNGSNFAGLKQVSAIGSTQANDEELHLEAVIVNSTHVSFYRDAQLASSVPINRPVTDCSVDAIEIGSKDLTIGELAFFARQLSEGEMEEIQVSGFTFESIAQGRKPHTPVVTDLEKVATTQKGRFGLAEEDRQLKLLTLQIDQKIASANVETLLSESTSVRSPGYWTFMSSSNCSTQWPPCYAITGISETRTTDTLVQVDYFNLLPPVGASSVYTGIDSTEQYVRFDVDSFPRFKGSSVTFTMWIKAEVGGGYLLTRQPDYNDAQRCWSLGFNSWRLEMYAGAVTEGGFVHEHQTIDFPPDSGIDLQKMRTWRHIAYVLDAETNSWKGYVDGSLVGERVYSAQDAVRKMDCDVGESGYVGFGHRAPGLWHATTELQDFRMYAGTALNSEQVRAVARTSRQECTLRSALQDASYVDGSGHDCAWYQEHRAMLPSVCSSQEVKQQCPVACKSTDVCFDPPNQGNVVTRRIWDRVRYLKKPVPESDSVLCVRKGLDVVSTCQSLLASKDPYSYPSSDSKLFQFQNYFHALTSIDILKTLFTVPNVTDCQHLASMLEPSCEFEPESLDFSSAVVQSNAWTISFWLKTASQYSLDVNSFNPSIVFWRSVAPPVPLVTITFTSGAAEIAFSGTCEDGQFEDHRVALGASPDVWTHISLVFGDRDGTVITGVMVDSTWVEERVVWKFCESQTLFPETSGEFIQGVSVTNSNEFLISPIEISNEAKNVGDIQDAYYNLKTDFALRKGPRNPDAFRVNRKVEYETSKFDQSTFLLAPPIVLQVRRRPAQSCSSEFASEVLHGVWQLSQEGITCTGPYECPAELVQDPLALAGCSEDVSPDSFFGKMPVMFRGEEKFTEFLVSITEAPVLVRNGTLFETANFLDQFSGSAEVVLVFFNPQYSITSLVSITANFDTKVTAEYEISQYQPLHGKEWRDYQIYSALGLISLAASLLWVAWRRHAKKLTNFALVIDVCNLILCTIFFGYKLSENSRSMTTLRQTTGALSKVPWERKDFSLDDKLASFFAGLSELEDRIGLEQSLSYFAFFVLFSVLFRTIISTAAHPRTAILVRTLAISSDDLWHFMILLTVIFGAFAIVGNNRFGAFNDEFATYGVTLQTMFNMMLGELPEDFGQETLLAIYTIVFNFIVFFLMLNFVIAIIVDAYVKIKTEIDENEAENEFFTDLCTSFYAVTRGRIRRWPHHNDMIKKLDMFAKKNVCRGNLSLLWKDWHHDSIEDFFDYYSQFDFMRPTLDDSEGQSQTELAIQKGFKTLTQTLACMLDRPVPTPAQVAVRVHNEQRSRMALGGGAAKSVKGSRAGSFVSDAVSMSAVSRDDGSHTEVNSFGKSSEGRDPAVKGQNGLSMPSQQEPPSTTTSFHSNSNANSNGNSNSNSNSNDNSISHSNSNTNENSTSHGISHSNSNSNSNSSSDRTSITVPLAGVSSGVNGESGAAAVSAAEVDPNNWQNLDFSNFGPIHVA